MTAPSTLGRVAVLLCFAPFGRAASDAGKAGEWWQSAPTEEQLGYVAGYIDCIVCDAGHSSLGKESWYALAPRISARYAERPDTATQPVSAILKALMNEASTTSPPAAGGEQYLEKHGFFDGEYWRQSEPEHRLGFIEGYLDCWRTEVTKGAQYSKPPSAYVDRLSEWFGLDAADPGVVRADRARTKIADALRLLRDK